MNKFLFLLMIKLNNLNFMPYFSEMKKENMKKFRISYKFQSNNSQMQYSKTSYINRKFFTFNSISTLAQTILFIIN